jgi:hypothetical protein
MRERTWDLPIQADWLRATEFQSLSFGRDGLTLDLLKNESGKPRKSRIHVPGPALRTLLLRANGSRHTGPSHRTRAIRKDFVVALSSLVGCLVLDGVLKTGEAITIVRAEHDDLGRRTTRGDEGISPTDLTRSRSRFGRFRLRKARHLAATLSHCRDNARAGARVPERPGSLLLRLRNLDPH